MSVSLHEVIMMGFAIALPILNALGSGLKRLFIK